MLTLSVATTSNNIRIDDDDDDGGHESKDHINTNYESEFNIVLLYSNFNSISIKNMSSNIK